MIRRKLNASLKFASLLALITLSYACDKSGDFIKVPETPITKTQTYTASAFVENSWTEGENFDTEESLRAILTSSGYAKPSLNVSHQEFDANDIRGHFSIVGENLSEQGSTTTLLETAPTTKVEGNALFIRETKGENAKAQIEMYCQLSENLQNSNPYVCLALGGKLDGSSLAYTTQAGTSPNKLIKGIKTNEEQAGRQLPLITQFQAFNKAFAEAKTELIYEPRGALIGFCFINKLGEEITITKLSFPQSNALFFEGSFDLSKTMENVRPSQAKEQALFLGLDEDFSFNVASENATLAPVTEEAKEAKTKLPLFYVWGFPHQGQTTLKMQVHYSKDGEEKQSEMLTLTVPQGGFKDGSTYRIPLVLSKKGTNEEAEASITTLEPYANKPNPNEYSLRELKNVSRKYTYRLALPVSYNFYNKFLHSDAAVEAFWEKTEQYLNKVYNRDLGIYFNVIKDKRLIARSESIMPAYLSQLSIINTWSSIELNKMIGKDAYDLGLWLTLGKGATQGLARLGGAYRTDAKASATVRVFNESVIAHELGHMFGAKHTWIGDTNESLRVERGEGQSIMTHAGYSDFFSLVSIADIFSYLHLYPYATDREKKHIIDPYSLSTQFDLDVAGIKKEYNIVYAKEVQATAPSIDVSKLKQVYRVPKGTFFSLEIPVKNPSKNMLYAANAIKVGDTEFFTMKSNDTGKVDFQEVYSFAGGLEPGCEPTMKAGTYPFRLAVSSFTESSVPSYATQDINLEVVEAEPFVIKGMPFSRGATISEFAGRKVTLRWTADQGFFGNDSKVRISMSDDYGQTYKYILAEEVENNGHCDIVLPYIEVGKLSGIYEKPINPCIVKVEELGGITYALTEYSARKGGSFTGGFSLTRNLTFNNVVFENCPPSVLHLDSESDLPQSYEIVAKKEGRFSNVPAPLTYTEYPKRTLSDGRKYIVREWTTPSPTQSWKSFAFRQYIYIKH